MTIRCGLVVLVSLACALVSVATPARLLHLSAGTAQTKPPETNQGKPSAASGSPSKKKGILHLRGTLVEGGAECQRFRASDNRYYTLEGNLHGFHTGDEVEITGKIPQGSHCRQDTPIRVETIRRAKPAKRHANSKARKTPPN